MNDDNGTGASLTDFRRQPSGSGAMVEAATTRQAQEVQAAMIVAKKFPRDETHAFSRIIQGCRRKGLAEQAMYAYPRGGTMVTGPSIRLAEAMAQAWGNIDFGIVELEQRDGESAVMAYAWDLETNTRQTKVFTVRHERHTKNGNKSLSDPRDIYEMVANNGARRLRACILGVIPGDVQDAAIEECEKTLRGGNKEPLADRVRKMVTAFDEYGVTQEMIEKRLGHKLDACIEQELVNLRKIYGSIKDGMAKREDFFEVHVAAETAREKLSGRKPEPKPEPVAERKPEPVQEPAREVGEEPPEPAAADESAFLEFMDSVIVRIAEAKGPRDLGKITQDVYKAGLPEKQQEELVSLIEAARGK